MSVTNLQRQEGPLMRMDLNFGRDQAGGVHDDQLVCQRACCDRGSDQ